MTLEDYILQHYSARQVNRYVQQIDQFRICQGSKAESSTYSDIVEYIGVLRTRDLHPKTIRNHLFCIKIYFRYLVTIGRRQDHPCENLTLKDQINRAIKVESLYTMETLEQLYKTFETPKDNRPGQEKTDTVKKRDKIILSLLIYQALTIRELIELRVNDIDLDEGTIRIRETTHPGRRSNKGRTLALKPNQILLFHAYLKKHWKKLWRRQKQKKRKDYFILSETGQQLHGCYLNRMLKKGRKPHEQYTPMKIRQSVIAHLLKENKDLRIVQEFAGHRKTGSTEVYKRTGLEELKSSIEKLHPLQ